ELHADLAVPVRHDDRRGAVGIRAAGGTQSEADPAAHSRDLESAARRAVLHAPQVRALAAAADLHRPVAARGDSRDRRDHGEGFLVQALLELTKPRIPQLVLLTAAAGFYLGARDRVDLLLLANTLIGTALVAGGTNAWNQIRERDVDARMARTRRRPLPS